MSSSSRSPGDDYCCNNMIVTVLFTTCLRYPLSSCVQNVIPPYLLAILTRVRVCRVRGSTRSFHWCGAVLVTSRHLLTAAHCVEDYPKESYLAR